MRNEKVQMVIVRVFFLLTFFTATISFSQISTTEVEEEVETVVEENTEEVSEQMQQELLEKKAREMADSITIAERAIAEQTDTIPSEVIYEEVEEVELSKKELKKKERDDKARAKLEKMLARPQRRHVLKTNLPSNFLGQMNFDYEYRITNRSTVGFALGLPNEQEIPEVFFDSETIDGLAVDQANFEGKSYRPHYRWYSAKKLAPRGFYLELYGKYQEYTGSFDGSYIDGDTYDVDSTIEFDNIGGGLSIGTQYLIGNRVVIDVSMLGFGLSSTNLSMRFNDQSDGVDKSYLDDLKQDIEEAIVDFPLGLDKKVDVSGGSNEEYIQVDGDGMFTPLPRFTLGVGIAF